MKSKSPMLCNLATILALSVLSTGALAQDAERVANEGTIGDKWMLADGTTLATAQYPAHMAARGANVCIALTYRIDKNGGTSDFSVAKQWNSQTGEKEPVDGFWQAFAEAGADAVSQWKFKPRPEVVRPVPTITIATLGFNGQADVDGAQLRGHCKIDDLAGHLAQIKAKRFERGDMNKQVQDRERIQQAQRDADATLRRQTQTPD